MTNTPISSAEIEFLKLLGVKPMRIGKDGEIEVGLNTLVREELEKIYEAIQDVDWEQYDDDD